MGGPDAVDWANLFLSSVPFLPTIKRPKQKGGRNILYGNNLGKQLTPAWIERAIRSAGRSKKRKGGRLTPRQMKTLRRATDPRRLGIFPQQRGAGLLSFITRPLARLFGKKVSKQAAKAVAKRVAKKAAKKAAAGAVTAGASWATQKALDQI